jgi:hypothetical protein
MEKMDGRGSLGSPFPVGVSLPSTGPTGNEVEMGSVVDAEVPQA